MAAHVAATVNCEQKTQGKSADHMASNCNQDTKNGSSMEDVNSDDISGSMLMNNKMKSPNQANEMTMENFQDGGHHQQNMNSDQSNFAGNMDGPRMNSELNNYSQSLGDPGIGSDDYGKINENMNQGQGFSGGYNNRGYMVDQHGGHRMGGSVDMSTNSQHNIPYNQYNPQNMRPAYPQTSKPINMGSRTTSSGPGINMMQNYNIGPGQQRFMAGPSLSQQSGPTPTLNQLLQSPNPSHRFSNSYNDYTMGQNMQKTTGEHGSSPQYQGPQSWPGNQRGMNPFSQQIGGSAAYRSQGGLMVDPSQPVPAKRPQPSYTGPNYPPQQQPTPGQQSQYGGQQYGGLPSQRYPGGPGLQGPGRTQLGVGNHGYPQQLSSQYGPQTQTPSVNYSQQQQQQSSYISQQQPTPPPQSQSLASQSLTSQSLASQSLASQSLASQSLASQSLASQSLASQSLTSQSLASQSLASQSLASQSLASQSLASQSLTSQSLTSQSLTSQSLTSQSLTSQSLTQHPPQSRTSQSSPQPPSSSQQSQSSQTSQQSSQTSQQQPPSQPSPQAQQQQQSQLTQTQSQSQTQSQIYGVSRSHVSKGQNQESSDLPDLSGSIDDLPTDDNSLGSQGTPSTTPLPAGVSSMRPTPSPAGSGGSRSMSPASISGNQNIPMPPRPPSSQSENVGQPRMSQSPMASQGYNQPMMPPQMGPPMYGNKIHPNMMGVTHMGPYGQNAQYPQGGSYPPRPTQGSMGMQSYGSQQPNSYPGGNPNSLAQSYAGMSGMNRLGNHMQTGQGYNSSYGNSINMNINSQYSGYGNQGMTSGPTMSHPSMSGSGSSMSTSPGIMPSQSIIASSKGPQTAAQVAAQAAAQAAILAAASSAVNRKSSPLGQQPSVSQQQQQQQPPPSQHQQHQQQRMHMMGYPNAGGGIVTQSMLNSMDSPASSMPPPTSTPMSSLSASPMSCGPPAPASPMPPNSSTPGPGDNAPGLVSSSGAGTSSTTSVTQSITTPVSTPSVTNASSESSQESTATINEDQQSDAPKHKKETTSHPPTPASTLPSPGAASMSSFHDEFENMSSPSWPRTPASPMEPIIQVKKRPDVLAKLMDLSDEPERRPFLEKLSQFNEERGTPITTCPNISKRPLDLYRLYLAAKERGGFVEVTKNKHWKEVATAICVGNSASAACTLRKHYLKYLLPFECKFDRGGMDPQPIISQLEAASRSKSKASSKAAAPSPGSQNSQDSFPAANNQSMDGFLPPPPNPGNQYMGPMGNEYGGPNMPMSNMGMMQNHSNSGESVNVQDPFADDMGSSQYPRQSTSMPMPNSYGYGNNPMRTGIPNSNMPPYSINQAGMPNSNNFGEPMGRNTMGPSVPEQFNDPYRRGMVNHDGYTSSKNLTDPYGYGNRNSMNQGNGPQYQYGSQFDRERFEQQGPMIPGNQPLRPPSQHGMMSPVETPVYPPRYGNQQMPPRPQPEQYPPRPYASPSQAQSYQNQGTYQEPYQGYPPNQQGMFPPQPNKTMPAARDPYEPPPAKRHADFVKPTPETFNVPGYNQSQTFMERPAMGWRNDNQYPPYQNQVGPQVSGPPAHPREDFIPETRPPPPPAPAREGTSPQWPPMHQRFPPSQQGGPPAPYHSSSNMGHLPPTQNMSVNMPASTGTFPPRNMNQMSPMSQKMSPTKDKPYMSPAKMPVPGPPIGPNAQQYAPRKEIVFPSDSVEAVEPVLVKRRRLYSRDIGPVEAWRLMMALKSGLLAESTWALDTLSILLFDDSTVLYFNLQHLPGLLEVLLEHLRRCLVKIFTLFKEMEVGFEAMKRVEEAKKRQKALKQETTGKTGAYFLDCIWEEKEILLDGENFTLNSRHGKTVKVVEKTDCFIYDMEKAWDAFEGFNSGVEHWQLGGGDMTAHIETHFENDTSYVKFLRTFSPKPKYSEDDVDNDDDTVSSKDQNEHNEICIKKENELVDEIVSKPELTESIDKTLTVSDSTDKNEQSETKEISEIVNKKELCNKSSENSINSVKCQECPDKLIKTEVMDIDSTSQPENNYQLVKIEVKEEKLEINNCELSCPKTTSQDSKCNEINRTNTFIPPPIRKRKTEEVEDEAYSPDEPSLSVVSEAQDSLSRRCICISNILRSLSFVPGNDGEMSKHPSFLLVLGKLLLLHHTHPPRRPTQRNYDKDEESDFSDSCSSLYGDKEWWWETLHALRENTLVILANISGQLDLSGYPEEISLPILDGLLHWAVCPSAYAQDPMPTMSPNSVLSPKRLSLEALCKLSIQDNNVDLILATPPFTRIEKLFALLTQLLSNRKEQVLREFAVVLISNLAQGESSACRAIACQNPCISLLIGFIEEAESNAYNVASTHGIAMLRDNPETMGTSLDMLRRAASTLLCLAKVPDNRPLFVQHQNRLLNLVMSQILDQHVASMVADVLYECSWGS